MTERIAQIKTATAVAIHKLGGLEAAATVCRASFQTLSGYQNRNRPDLVMPVDVALQLDAALGEPVMLSAMARMLGFKLQAPDAAAQPDISGAVAAIAGGAGQLVARFVSASADGVLDASEQHALAADAEAMVRAGNDVLAAVAPAAKLRAVG